MPAALLSAILIGFAAGSYRPILYVAAVLFVVGAVALLSLGRYPSFDAAPQAPTPG